MHDHALDQTHDPAARSWIASANDAATDFPVQNLPIGIFHTAGTSARGGVAIGDRIVDLAALGATGALTGRAAEAAAIASAPTLNALFGADAEPLRALRAQLFAALTERAEGAARVAVESALVPMRAAHMELPVAIGGFTDFLCSIDHSRRMGRGSLPPAFHHLPIAYNSRASSVRPSGTDVRRPRGQYRDCAGTWQYGFEPNLDFELEVGVIVGRGNELGDPLSVGEAEARIAGLCLVNDWSARGIQFFESVPLGPFLGKNFATTVSPWVVTPDALAPFRCVSAPREIENAAPPHLDAGSALGGFDIALTAGIITSRMRAAGEDAFIVTATNARTMYWTFAQMVAHHSSNGCNLTTGDLIASGTTSGPTDASRACMVEITAFGTEPIAFPNGEQRVFLEDGDEVVFRARAERPGFVPIGFGEARGVISA